MPGPNSDGPNNYASNHFSVVEQIGGRGGMHECKMHYFINSFYLVACLITGICIQLWSKDFEWLSSDNKNITDNNSNSLVVPFF